MSDFIVLASMSGLPVASFHASGSRTFPIARPSFPNTPPVIFI